MENTITESDDIALDLLLEKVIALVENIAQERQE